MRPSTPPPPSPTAPDSERELTRLRAELAATKRERDHWLEAALALSQRPLSA